MASFVEVSGYSQDDLDDAYNRGYAAGGGSALQGDATQAQVLSGYTFSSAAVGSNKQGTMVNNGNVSQQLNPGDSYTQAGYHSSLNITAKANSQTYTFPNNSTGGTAQNPVDLGAANLYRYINANAVYNKGKVDGQAQALANWYNEVDCVYLMNSQGAMAEGGRLQRDVTPTKNGLITIDVTLWRATTASPRTFPDISNFSISGATLLSFTNNPLIANGYRDNTSGNTASATGSRLTAIAKCTANTQVNFSFDVSKGCVSSTMVRQIAI